MLSPDGAESFPVSCAHEKEAPGIFTLLEYPAALTEDSQSGNSKVYGYYIRPKLNSEMNVAPNGLLITATAGNFLIWGV